MGSQHNIDTERQVFEAFRSEPRWSISGLRVKLHDIDPNTIDAALVGLLVEGLLIRDGAQRWVIAPCVAHLDALGLLNPDGRTDTITALAVGRGA